MMPLRWTLCLMLFTSPAFAQDRATPGDEMIYKYLCAESDKLSLKFLDGAKSLAEWQQKRPRLYQEYMDLLGLWPLPEKTPLHAKVTGTIEAHGVIVEKLHFQSKPGLYVTANVYRPREPKGKLPAIVYVCGHSSRGRDGSKSAFQDHGFWFANNGYVCIILDTLQLGEIPGVHHGTYGRTTAHYKSWGLTPKEEKEPRWWWHSLGYSPAAVEAWNGVRAIDYLVSRSDVDAERIGVTGISGGGAATFWIAAADDRVKVAVPVSGMSDLESYVKNKVVNGHCDCMFLHNTYQWDWSTIAALVAPRPLLFANSDNDPIFPMDGNRRIIAKLRTVYKMYDKADLVDDYVSVGGHDYRPDLRIAIFKFISKHLKGDTTSPVEDSAKYTPLKGPELRVFATDADLPKDAINGRIDETFIAKGQVKLPEKGKFEEWKKAQLSRLRALSFRGLTDPVPKAKLRKGELDFFKNCETEEGISTWLFDAGDDSLLVVLAESEKKSKKDWDDWFQKNFPDGAFVFGPRGVVTHRWTAKSPPNYVERSHALLGKTIDEARVLDVAATARTLAKRQRLMGKGKAGILAAYAALFEPSIKEVIVIDPPKSHREGPHFLNVLRVLDIPEALGLLAPTPLTIIGGQDAAFDRTAEIYRLAGAEGKLTRK